MLYSHIHELCDIVRETSFLMHRYLRGGHVEKVYANALAHRLHKAGMRVEQRYPIKAFDEDGTGLGSFFADLLVEGCLIVEAKACTAIVSEPVAQILGYLRPARRECGLLVNFGAPRLYIRKFIMT